MAIHCPVCGWKFGSEKSLQRHMAAHHSEAERRAVSGPQPSPPPEPPPEARPGWYPHPSGKGTLYWDGSEWVGWASREPKPEPRPVGRLALALSYVAAVVLPLVGFLAGIWLLVRRRTDHGIAVILIAIVVGALGALPLLLSSHDSGGTPTGHGHAARGVMKCAKGRLEPGTRLNACIDRALR